MVVGKRSFRRVVASARTNAPAIGTRMSVYDAALPGFWEKEARCLGSLCFVLLFMDSRSLEIGQGKKRPLVPFSV